MSLITGLKALNDYIDNQSSNDGGGARWLKLKDGQIAKIWFLQELDKDSFNYNEKYGTAVLAVEHSAGPDYMKKAQCTYGSEGRCFACEMNQKEPKTGWNSRGRLYVNVLVDDEKDGPYVAVLSQGISNKSITPTLVMFAGDAGSITDTAFRIRRTGEKLKTSYAITSIPRSEGVDASQYELFDLDKIVPKYVPYDEQEAYYAPSQHDEEPVEEVVESSLEW